MLIKRRDYNARRKAMVLLADNEFYSTEDSSCKEQVAAEVAFDSRCSSLLLYE